LPFAKGGVVNSEDLLFFFFFFFFFFLSEFSGVVALTEFSAETVSSSIGGATAVIPRLLATIVTISWLFLDI
jgi:hypothetical protein